MKRRILVFFLSLTISHTYINKFSQILLHQHRTKYISHLESEILFQLDFRKIYFSTIFPFSREAFSFSKMVEHSSWNSHRGWNFVWKTDARAPLPEIPACMHGIATTQDLATRLFRVCFAVRGGGRFTWIILVPLVNEYPSPRNKGQATQASSSLLESDIVLLSSRRSLHPTSRESGG